MVCKDFMVTTPGGRSEFPEVFGPFAQRGSASDDSDGAFGLFAGAASRPRWSPSRIQWLPERWNRRANMCIMTESPRRGSLRSADHHRKNRNHTGCLGAVAPSLSQSDL